MGGLPRASGLALGVPGLLAPSWSWMLVRSLQLQAPCTPFLMGLRREPSLLSKLYFLGVGTGDKERQLWGVGGSPEFSGAPLVCAADHKPIWPVPQKLAPRSASSVPGFSYPGQWLRPRIHTV